LIVSVTESLQGLHSKIEAVSLAASRFKLCSVIFWEQLGHWRGRSSKG
jgi:hypothetical protein